MESPLAADPYPHRFDLTSEAALARRQDRGMRAGLAVVGLVIVGIGIALVVGTGDNLLAGTPLLMLGGGFLLLSTRVKDAGAPAEIIMDREALRVRFSDGTDVRRAWTDPAWAFRVVDSAADDSVSPEQRAHLSIAFSDGHAGTVPKSLLVALDDAAITFGLPRLARREKQRVGRAWVVQRVVRFGDPTRSPGWADAQEVPAGQGP